MTNFKTFTIFLKILTKLTNNVKPEKNVKICKVDIDNSYKCDLNDTKKNIYIISRNTNTAKRDKKKNCKFCT